MATPAQIAADQALIKREVKALVTKYQPGVNPLLTREVWEALVRDLGFRILAERVKTAADDADLLKSCGAGGAQAAPVDCSAVIMAVEAELARQWEGF